MKYLINFISFYLLCVCSAAGAAVTPLVINSEFKTDSWFPLPVDQMESAAVDSALTSISGFGKFAFLYKPDSIQAKNAGTLTFVVSLVEVAESAKITIRLNMPNNKQTYVSTASVSLSNMDYRGIFNALQKVGSDAASKLSSSLESIGSEEKISDKEQSVINQLVWLNLEIIDLRKSKKPAQLQNHNSLVMNELGKLDTIINKIDAHHDYVKKSNEATNRKLDTQHDYVKRSNQEINRKLDTQHDYVKRSNEEVNKKLDTQHEYVKRKDVDNDRKLSAIYSEISKLNVGRNTDNSSPMSKELSKYDHSQLSKFTKSREMKFNLKFHQAKLILLELLSDRKISIAFSKAINEELNINLPLYEAQIIITEVSTQFVKYLKNDEYKVLVKHAEYLYDGVLSQPDLLFKKRIEINQKKDQLNLTVNSMVTVAITMKASSLDMLSHSLRDAFFRNRALSAMNVEGAGGHCPGREKIDAAIKKSKIYAPVLSYKTGGDDCELILAESDDDLLVYVFNEADASYVRKQR